MGIKRFFNSAFKGTHYRLVNQVDYERIYACKEADVSAADGVGRSITGDLLKLFPGNRALTILDIGANKGGTYRLFRSHFPKSTIHCFEPDPRAHKKLAAVAGNDPLTRLHAFAVSDKNEEIEFHLANDTVLSSILALLPAEDGNAQPFEKIRVESVALDSFAARTGLERIDILKMDIQGAELRALDGASRLLDGFKIGCLYLELVFTPDYECQALAADVIGYLQQRSYNLCGFYNLHYNAGSEALYFCDALFIPNQRQKPRIGEKSSNSGMAK